MEDKVRAFNSFPSEPNGRYRLATNPHTGQIYQGGPAPILSLPTIEEKAEAIIPCLLDVFIRPSTPVDAPWSWAILDADLAQAMGVRLKEHGVALALCEVDIIRKAVSPGDSTKWHGCRCAAQCFFEPLRECSGCGMAFYHSEECQKKHWKMHKAKCGTPGATPSTGSNGNSIIEAHEYLRSEAINDPAARSLMEDLRLDDDAYENGLALIIHRLVFTGRDTPDNMRLLFGPHYTHEEQIKLHHQRIRVELLVDPFRGSPWYAINTQLGMFDPDLVRAVRPANAAETRQVDEIRGIQAAFERAVATDTTPSLADMPASIQDFSKGFGETIRITTLAEQMMEHDFESWVQRLSADVD
ncbi:hypothetical protein V8F33_011294 [Rhypophila sp. PSN 637]